MSDAAYARLIVPNRSLSPQGRSLWLGLIVGSCVAVAGAVAIAGAWMVFPFAGIVVALFAWAFSQVAKGDSDFERIEVQDGQVLFEAAYRGKSVSISGSGEWMQLEQRVDGYHCNLILRYAGQCYPLGLLLSDEQRMSLASELRSLLRVDRQVSRCRHN